MYDSSEIGLSFKMTSIGRLVYYCLSSPNRRESGFMIIIMIWNIFCILMYDMVQSAAHFCNEQ